ncbi:MAG: RHS repeat-associated core domain-containing protein [Cyclobacteriaceae bacterium]|nr:RHS repeat-associated core domain-containing protein [Cyclobacteriaceae bacterium]
MLDFDDRRAKFDARFCPGRFFSVRFLLLPTGKFRTERENHLLPGEKILFLGVREYIWTILSSRECPALPLRFTAGVLRKGEVRYVYPSGYTWGTTPTDYTCTGQYSNVPDFGLMYYNARWLRSVPEAQRKGYDPGLGRFTQADTIVPGGVQGLDRYAYVNNSPLNYIDPTGHLSESQIRNLLGKNYDKLWSLWKQHDLYWITVLTELQIGDTLYASMLDGVGLQVQGNGDNVTLVVLGGEYSANLEAWQGKGAYLIDRPGKSDDWKERKRDEMFNQNSYWNAVYEPSFEYTYDDDGNVNWDYEGAIQVNQKLNDQFEYQSWVMVTANAIGLGDHDDFWGLAVDLVLLRSNPVVGACSSAADLVITLFPYNRPSSYSVGWPGGVLVNQYIELNDLK